MNEARRFRPQILALSFAFTFAVVRTVYFCLLPTGHVNQITDFLLVVLPNFLYFSIFSIFVAVWASKKFSKEKENTNTGTNINININIKT